MLFFIICLFLVIYLHHVNFNLTKNFPYPNLSYFTNTTNFFNFQAIILSSIVLIITAVKYYYWNSNFMIKFIIKIAVIIFHVPILHHFPTFSIIRKFIPTTTNLSPFIILTLNYISFKAIGYYSKLLL